MLRYLRSFAEFIAAFVGVFLLVLALLVWRLSSSPINSTFMTPYIEAGFEHVFPDAHPQIEHTLLTWDNVDHTVALHADGVVIKNGKGNVVAEVPNLDIRLSLLGLAVGQFLPRELTLDHPQIRLDRHADGQLFFSDMTTSSPASDDQVATHDVVKKALYNLTHAYAMRHLTVYRAVVEVHDVASNSVWSVSIPEISVKHTLSQLVGNAKIDITQKDQVSSLELHYVYDRLKALHQISTRFQDITPSQLVGEHPETLGLGEAAMLELPLSGEMETAFDPDLNVAAAAVTLHGGAGLLRVPQLWDKPRAVSGLDIEGDFDNKAHKLNIVMASFDFGGPKISLTAAGHAPDDPNKYDLDFTMTAHMQNWPMETLDDFWPKSLVTDARDWVVPNLAKGVYDKGEATFTGSLAWNDLANVNIATGQGKISASHGSVSYIDGMPPVENVRTEAAFDLKQMTLQIAEGNIGNLKLQPFAIKISGLDAADQYIDIPLRVSGPIAEIVKLINHPPLRYAQAVGLAPDALSGTAEGAVNLRFELLKALSTKDIAVTANAKLSNVASSQLIKGVDLSQGELVLDLDKDGFAVKGPLAIDKVPFQLALQQYFHEMPGKPLQQVNISGNVKDEQWKALGVDALAGTRGTSAVALQMMRYGKAKTLVSGTLDFTGSDLRVEPLNWKKPVGTPANLQFSAEMAEGNDIVVRSILLRSPQANAQGRAVLSPEGKIKSVSLEPLVVGRTNANLYFVQSDAADGALRFDARGKSLDISGMKGGKDPQRADPRPKEYHLNVDKLYTGENGIITQAEGFAVRDSVGWSAINLRGFADGEHQFAMELTPQPDGTRTFSIMCDDFGKLLKGLGLTDAVKQGDIKIVGQSAADNPRVIEGTVKIGSFSVGNLPVMMLLLNATSPFGFVGIVTSSASFEHMRGTFRWEGDEVELKQINAAGSSVGMNIDGKVDMNSGSANLYGTLVPFSMVNRILEAIPVIGDILTGGEGGGVLAVAYRIKGTLSEPKVSVNPVSLLTPGFLRNLFFGGDDEKAPTAKEATPQSPAPETSPPPSETQSKVVPNTQ